MNSINTSYPVVGCLESKQGGRAENQDFVGFADTPLGFLLVLCDGMGGGPGGRTASTSTVDTVIAYVSKQDKAADRKEVLAGAIKFADANILNYTQAHPELSGMGTTIVCLLINEQSAMVAHVGDSRLYQFRYKRKQFRTADHSVVGEMVRNGAITEEQARTASNSNVITRAINGRGIAEPDIVELPYEKGDRFMVCTDGIWGAMEEGELMRKATENKVIDATVVNLSFEVDEIGKNSGNHHDNLTLAILETGTNSKKPVPMSKKALKIIAGLAALLVLSIVIGIACSSHYAGEASKKSEEILLLQDRIARLKTDSKAFQSVSAEKEAEGAAEGENPEKENKVAEELKQKEAAEAAAKAKAEAEEAAAKAAEEAKKKDAQTTAQAKPGKGKIPGDIIAILDGWAKGNGMITAASIDQLISRIKNDTRCNTAISVLEKAKNERQVAKQSPLFKRAHDILAAIK